MEIIKTGYTLRHWRKRDKESLIENGNNVKIWLNLRDAFPYPYTEDKAKDWLECVMKQTNIFAIVVDDMAVGAIAYFSNHDVERLNAEIVYWLGEAYWNRGIMTDVLSTLSEYIFTSKDIIRLYATPYEYNPASMRVLEKAGFTKVGIMRKAIYKNHRFLDLHYYELLKTF